LLRVMAGPDGWDTNTVEMELGDPSTVSLDGLLVTVVEDSSTRPMSRDLRDARERAVGALVAAGARVRRVSMPSWKGALLPFLAALQNTGTNATRINALLKEAGQQQTNLWALLFGEGQHTLPTRLTVLAEAIPTRGSVRDKLLARSGELAAELIEAIGDGVLLHPAQLTAAPPHRRTYGRPWVTTPTSVFNLAGVPVTEVPLGLGSNGLPVGVQVAAARRADHLSIAIAVELEAVFGGWVPPEL
jgi:fatty acid amide hydrolase 2